MQLAYCDDGQALFVSAIGPTSVQSSYIGLHWPLKAHCSLIHYTDGTVMMARPSFF